MKFSIGDRSAFLTLDLGMSTQKYIYERMHQGGYEPETSSEIVSRLGPGDTFVDVGAHTGFFTVLASLIVGDTGWVYSFEADEKNYSYLRTNTLSLKNVSIVKAVISDIYGMRPFYHNADNDGGHSIWDCSTHPLNEKTRQSPKSENRLSLPLDTFEIANPCILKIDTEGAEIEVLRGAYKLLSKPSLKFVVCECNNVGLVAMGHAPKDIPSLLGKYGFKMLPFDEKTYEQGYVVNLFFER